MKSLKSILQYAFKSENLLNEAMTHKSFSIDKNKDKAHNERLEFLGDSILNFVIADELVKKFPLDPEGLLSKKRATLVNQSTLHLIAEQMGLSEHIKFGPGELKQGSATNPRILASTLEAIMGAMYLDSNFEVTKMWILNVFKDIPLDQLVDDIQTQDHKTRLQEWTQKKGWGIPKYELVTATGPSHKPQFLVSLKIDGQEKTRAEAGNKKAAEQKAAELYINELKKTEKEV